MKIGDIVKKNFIRGSLIGIVTNIKPRSPQCNLSYMIEVMWPGCEPFWTQAEWLEVVNGTG